MPRSARPRQADRLFAPHGQFGCNVELEEHLDDNNQTLVEIELRGAAGCEVTGFIAAVGHDRARLRFLDASPGEFLLAHAGEDLAFEVTEANDEGFAVVGAIFDLSPPLAVPPVAIPEGTVLARLDYEVLPSAPPGSTTLENRTRRFGRVYPVANVFSRRAGEPPLEPVLEDGLATAEAAADLDADGIPDACDNRAVPNPAQSDVDIDGAGDLCDPYPAHPADLCEPAGSAALEASPTSGGSLASDDGALALVVEVGDLAAAATRSATQLELADPQVNLAVGAPGSAPRWRGATRSWGATTPRGGSWELSAPVHKSLACPSGESRPTALLRSLDDRLRKIDSLARRAAGRLRSLGCVGRDNLSA